MAGLQVLDSLLCARAELFRMHTHKLGLWHFFMRHVFFLHPEQDILLTLRSIKFIDIEV